MIKVITFFTLVYIIPFHLSYGVTTTVFYDMDIIEQNPDLVQPNPIHSRPTDSSSNEDYFVDFNTPYVEQPRTNNASTTKTQHAQSFSSMSTQYSGKPKNENEEFFNKLKESTPSSNKHNKVKEPTEKKEVLYFYDF